MKPRYAAYQIWPRIVPADKSVDMKIVPTGRIHTFFQDETYDLTIISVGGDEEDYRSKLTTNRNISVKADKGIISFPYVFEGEQEYLIILKRDNVKLADFSLYSLYEDLYQLKPLKGDLHSHSYRSDGQSDPASLAGHFREQGYDFQALTDHNRFYPGSEVDLVYQGVTMGYTRVTGEEVHTPGSPVHIVHVGGKASVTEIYLHQREKFNAEVEECRNNLPSDVPAQFAERYALAKWACDSIHKAGGLSIFAHPYWAPNASKAYNVNDCFSSILLKSGMFDLFEICGGMSQVGINRAVALWSDLRAEGVDVKVCGSSDVHNLDDEKYFPTLYTVAFARENTNDSIIEALREGYSVGVETINLGSRAEEFRCYGKLRLVSYANFLLRHYFPDRQRYCQSEGVAMRAYAMGEIGAELIEAQYAFTKSYEDKYFGKKPPVLPTKQMLEQEDEWRAIHIKKGPNTKGSDIEAQKTTRQI